MELFNEFMTQYGLQIIGTLLLALAGAFGLIAKNLATKYLNDKTKQSIAKTVVQGVEQVYKNLHGEEKLNQAMAMFSDLLAEKGITISELEMRLLLESAVGEFNRVFETGSLTAENTPVEN